MSSRTMSVRLVANIQQYRAGLAQASAHTREFGREITGQGRATSAQIEQVGRSALIMGGLMAAGFGLSAKAAVDWESSFAGVQKTVDGTAEEMGRLEAGLRDMATELPATHDEIAGVAEAAGQLGVQTGAVEGFTRTMVDLGETTNLSAEEAATSLARLSNIMGTSISDVDRMGSTIVDLGNNSATTEAEITEMATRLAAAGQIAGLSEADVLAFASTLTSVGVRAEAGGTALSKVFTKIRDATLTGGEALDTFADVAGTTAEDFTQAFQDDPAKAIASFIEGLGRMNESGDSTTATFEELELTDQRLMRSLLSTAEAGGLLADQLDLAGDAWEENTALQTEAEKRYETTAAQFEIMRNKVTDLGIDLGSVLLPAINDAVGAMGNMADGLAALPGPVKNVMTLLGTGAAGGLGLVGILGVMAPKVREAKSALMNMGTGAQFVGRNMGRITGVLAGVGVAVGVGAMAYERATRKAREYDQTVKELAQSFGPVREGQASVNEALDDFLAAQEADLGKDALDAMRALDVSMADIRDSIAEGGSALDPLKESLAELGVDVDQLFSDNVGVNEFNEALFGAAEAAGVSGSSLLDLVDAVDEYQRAAQDRAETDILGMIAAGDLTQEQVDQAAATNTLADGTTNWVGVLDMLAPTSDKAAGGADELTGAIGEQGEQVGETADAFDKLRSKIEGQFDPYLDLADAVRGHEDALRGVDDAQRRHDEAQAESARAAADVQEAQEDLAEAMSMVADEAEAARRGVSEYTAEQRGAVDPLFSMLEALERQRDLLADGDASPLDVVRGAAGVSTAAAELAGSIATGDVSLEESRQMLREWADEGLITGEQAKQVGRMFEEAATEAENLEGANVRGAIASEKAAERQRVQAERADAVADAQDRLDDALRRAADAERDVAEAARGIDDALSDVTESAVDLELKMIALRGAMSRGDTSIREVRERLGELVDQGIITREDADRTIETFETLGDRVMDLDDSSIDIPVDVDDEEARRKMDELNHALAIFGGRDPITAEPDMAEIGSIFGGRPTPRAAAGGFITAAGDVRYRAHGGPSGTDTIPAWLTPGEYVMQKSAVDTYGAEFMQALNNQQLVPGERHWQTAGGPGGGGSIDYGRLGREIARNAGSRAEINLNGGDHDEGSIARHVAWLLAD